MTTEPYSEAIQEPETVKPANYFSILGNLFFSPGKAFQEVNRSPRIFWPIIGLVVVLLLGYYNMFSKIDMQSMFSAQMDSAVAQGQMTKQDAEQQAQRIAGFTKVLVPFIVVFVAIFAVLSLLALAGLWKLICMIIGAENTFRAVFTVTLFSFTAYQIVHSVLFALIASFKDVGSLSPTEISTVVGSNLGAILGSVLETDALPRFFMNLARFIDILNFWLIALLAIGYAAVSKKLKTSTAAVWLFSVYAVFAVIVSAFMKAPGSMTGR